MKQTNEALAAHDEATREVQQGRHIDAFYIGKSETVHQIAEMLGLELIDRCMSHMNEDDVIGLPRLDNACTKP